MKHEQSTSKVQQLVKTCVRDNIPYAVQFELTTDCNLKCRHCFMVKNNYVELSTDEIKGIIDQLVEIGTFYLAFTGGEIFTRDDLFDILGYAKEKGFFMTLMTNGTLIMPKHIEELKRLKPVKFEISLYGVTPETHDNITCTDGSFKQTVFAIDSLIKEGFEVIIKMPLMNLNFQESEEMEKQCAKRGVHLRMNPGMAPSRGGSTHTQQYDLSDNDLRTFLAGHKLDLSYLHEKDPAQRFKCKAGNAACSITSAGLVYPCVIMPIQVGNLRQQSFKYIWNIDPCKELRRLRDLRSHDLDECSRCESKPFCVRCPGVTYLETNDIVRASPSACRYAAIRKTLENNQQINLIQTGSEQVLSLTAL